MFLNICDLYKSFGSEQVLRGVTFTLAETETLSVLGRSGGGKTTMLKIIAGLENPDRGRIELGGTDISASPPQKRGIVYLSQESLLLPHLNLFENIAFGLRLRKLSNAQIQQRVRLMIRNLELEGQEQKMPRQLSGGQRQRTSFGRAIIVEPALLLLDEPFGSLDVETRTNMQKLFKRLAFLYKIPSIFVTHDLKEAILMGDRIATMRKGLLQVYSTRQAFIEDRRIGVLAEIAFWNGLRSNHHEPKPNENGF